MDIPDNMKLDKEQMEGYLKRLSQVSFGVELEMCYFKTTNETDTLMELVNILHERKHKFAEVAPEYAAYVLPYNFVSSHEYKTHERGRDWIFEPDSSILCRKPQYSAGIELVSPQFYMCHHNPEYRTELTKADRNHMCIGTPEDSAENMEPWFFSGTASLYLFLKYILNLDYNYYIQSCVSGKSIYHENMRSLRSGKKKAQISGGDCGFHVHVSVHPSIYREKITDADSDKIPDVISNEISAGEIEHINAGGRLHTNRDVLMRCIYNYLRAWFFFGNVVNLFLPLRRRSYIKDNHDILKENPGFFYADIFRDGGMSYAQSVYTSYIHRIHAGDNIGYMVRKTIDKGLDPIFILSQPYDEAARLLSGREYPAHEIISQFLAGIFASTRYMAINCMLSYNEDTDDFQTLHFENRLGSGGVTACANETRLQNIMRMYNWTMFNNLFLSNVVEQTLTGTGIAKWTFDITSYKDNIHRAFVNRDYFNTLFSMIIKSHHLHGYYAGEIRKWWIRDPEMALLNYYSNLRDFTVQTDYVDLPVFKVSADKADVFDFANCNKNEILKKMDDMVVDFSMKTMMAIEKAIALDDAPSAIKFMSIFKRIIHRNINEWRDKVFTEEGVSTVEEFREKSRFKYDMYRLVESEYADGMITMADRVISTIRYRGTSRTKRRIVDYLIKHDYYNIQVLEKIMDWAAFDGHYVMEVMDLAEKKGWDLDYTKAFLYIIDGILSDSSDEHVQYSIPIIKRFIRLGVAKNPENFKQTVHDVLNSGNAEIIRLCIDAYKENGGDIGKISLDDGHLTLSIVKNIGLVNLFLSLGFSNEQIVNDELLARIAYYTRYHGIEPTYAIHMINTLLDFPVCAPDADKCQSFFDRYRDRMDVLLEKSMEAKNTQLIQILLDRGVKMEITSNMTINTITWLIRTYPGHVIPKDVRKYFATKEIGRLPIDTAINLLQKYPDYVHLTQNDAQLLFANISNSPTFGMELFEREFLDKLLDMNVKPTITIMDNILRIYNVYMMARFPRLVKMYMREFRYPWQVQDLIGIIVKYGRLKPFRYIETRGIKPDVRKMKGYITKLVSEEWSLGIGLFRYLVGKYGIPITRNILLAAAKNGTTHNWLEYLVPRCMPDCHEEHADCTVGKKLVANKMCCLKSTVTVQDLTDVLLAYIEEYGAWALNRRRMQLFYGHGVDPNTGNIMDDLIKETYYQSVVTIIGYGAIVTPAHLKLAQEKLKDTRMHRVEKRNLEKIIAVLQTRLKRQELWRSVRGTTPELPETFEGEIFQGLIEDD